MHYKWIGALLIIAGCGGFGFSLVLSQLREEKSLQQLAFLVDFMACELQFRLTALPALCQQVSGQATGDLRSIFSKLSILLEQQLSADVSDCLEKAMNEIPSLQGKIRSLLQELGATLGRFDLDGQLKGLESVRAQCRRELETIRCDRDTRLRSYQTLSLCCGAALAILLI